MAVEIRKYTQDGVNVVEEMVPPMMVVVDTYHPHSTPWDCYGRNHQREYTRVLKLAGVDCVCLETHNTRINPYPSGPNGRVRFGDDMMPSTYRIAVNKYDMEKAEAAIAAHKTAVEAWLNNNAPVPEACLS